MIRPLPINARMRTARLRTARMGACIRLVCGTPGVFSPASPADAAATPG